MLAAAELAHGRLVPFCRVDPHNGGLREAQRAVRLGAAGIKLHPRAERFGLGDPAVGELTAFADERRLPVIVHAGRGIPSLGRDALDLARAYPRAPLILAHAAIADLAWIWHEAAGQRNLFFDTAWWNTADQLAMFALIPPGQILFASDTPYGRTIAAASVRKLLDRHTAYTATDPPRRGPRPSGVHMIFVAAAVARIPVLP